MQMYEVPGGVVDWECPNGLKWHATSSVIQEAIAAGALTKRPSPPIVRKRISIPPNALLECNICSDQRGCPNVSVCCGGQISVNIQGPCPHGKW